MILITAMQKFDWTSLKRFKRSTGKFHCLYHCVWMVLFNITINNYVLILLYWALAFLLVWHCLKQHNSSFIICLNLGKKSICKWTETCYSPSSFLSLGSLFVASSIQLPSAAHFSSNGFPTNTRSTRDGRSASFRNSAEGTNNIIKCRCHTRM